MKYSISWDVIAPKYANHVNLKILHHVEFIQRSEFAHKPTMLLSSLYNI